ncbi:DinB family protein [Moheibacter stercoris]|uniref:DNA-directed RNA polymerase subunit H (RpoH/RPB5) n=1 Tax=Moheibacter stercoris TaxID=1628251 RepID=A0ABV2LTD9_9FLAO
MKFNSVQLLEELKELTENHVLLVNKWKELPRENWVQRPNENSWNALECLEHLNYYGNFYLPEIEQQMKSSNFSHSEHFHSGILGNYFAKSMLPKSKGGKMKTFKEMNPIGKNLDHSVIEHFISQQEKLRELLNLAHQKNLTKIKTSISISKRIKLRLGDTLRIVIYHNERHLQQAEKTLFG